MNRYFVGTWVIHNLCSVSSRRNRIHSVKKPNTTPETKENPQVLHAGSTFNLRIFVWVRILPARDFAQKPVPQAKSLD